MIPRALYRLQFHSGFGFDAATAIVPYLQRLGVSHVYASSYLKARAGSTHGYDVVDHAALNPELGDGEAFARLLAALRAHGIGQVLDFVPNHMGIGGADNHYWLDVMEWGQNSAFAGWFDIDWYPMRGTAAGKLLVPFLGESYGAALAHGQLRLTFDAPSGSFSVRAHDAHVLPISPLSYSMILAVGAEALRDLADAFADLPRWYPQMSGRAGELKAELASRAASDGAFAEAVAAAVAQFTGEPDNVASWHRLNSLIETQHWRPAHARVAADEINYRRFFNISDLAGLRVELPEVFDHAHRLVLALVRDGTLSGLRIDHIDGLLEPTAYLRHLGERAGQPFHIWVEKILGRDEDLPAEWPVEGTTGYEFVNLILNLMVDRAGVEAFTHSYQDFTGEKRSFAEIVYACKRRIMEDEMAAELHALARAAAAIARQDPRTVDLSENLLRRALEEYVACLPLYRTYIDTRGRPAEHDRARIAATIETARRGRPALGAEIFDFLHALLNTDLASQRQVPEQRVAIRLFAARVQQFSGPVMAKGLEDTAFYQYNRFVALNEVGGSPDMFGTSVADFHAATLHRAQHWPHTMLGTATHDTKRGEDTRARLAALSEFAGEWDGLVRNWSGLLQEQTDQAPDRNDEYLIYQLLLGAWPSELLGDAAFAPGALDAFAARVRNAITKSMREAKVHTTWGLPNPGYEAPTLAFVDRALDPARSKTFLEAFLPFVERLAARGARNSVLQAALKLTLPGVPDIYQGTDLWDLNLVDPDNRRPVDFSQREDALATVAHEIASGRTDAMSRYAENWRDGRVKLATLHILLDFRRQYPELLERGTYEPLAAAGKRSEQVCAFARRHEQSVLIVIGTLGPSDKAADPRGAGAMVILPEDLGGRVWHDLLTGRQVKSPNGLISLDSLLPAMPVTVLCYMPFQAATQPTEISDAG